MTPPALSITISGLARLFGHDLRQVVDVARAADELGVHQLVLPDHVAIGPRTDRYPFGTFPYPPAEPWLEPMTTLAVLAGATEHIRLGTGILVAPLRPAVLLAKQAATLDVLSDGRLDLGVGAGWQEEEFTACGVDYAARGRILDDTVRACQALWTTSPASFDSPTVRFQSLWSEPRPAQAGGVPVWFAGGATRRTARRVVELSAGWLPVAGTPMADIEAGIALIAEECQRTGRDPATVGVRAGLPQPAAADGSLDLGAARAAADALGEMGVTAVSAGFGRFVAAPADVVPFLERLTAAWNA